MVTDNAPELLINIPATHKVEEVTTEPRHPFTQYLCAECFARLMGPTPRR